MEPGTVINAFASACAAISAWAAYKTVHQAKEAAGLARMDRNAERAAQRRLYRRRIVPALYQVLIDARTSHVLVTQLSDRSEARMARMGRDLHLWLNYAPRLFELEGDLGILPEGEANPIARAVEAVRQYEAFIARFAGRDSEMDPFESGNFVQAFEAQYQLVHIAIDEAIAPYQPGMPPLED